MAERKITRIESRTNLHAAIPNAPQRKRRVAAYARVSTDSDEQLSSYEAQVGFYTQYIKNNPDWEFVAVYTDEGVTGTNTKKREGFNRMIADALSGKIDLILTKAVSRFARNTVDSLTAIRKLKEHGVEVYFEEQNIWTFDSKGEMLITIMSSLAQEESRSISENVTWGKRRSMEEGKICLGYKHFLGYEKGEDGLPRIVEEQAEVVRRIYRLFLEGWTVRAIADQLTSEGIPTPAGKRKWSVSTIMSILQNEKYKGDALLQKTYTADFLNKTVKKNKGEVPQVYIENSHPAIISPDTFDLVQKEIERRRPKRRQLHKSSPFACKIICGDCGGFYGRKVWHSGTKYRSHIWRCNRKYDSGEQCSTPNFQEDMIKDAFITAVNQLLGNKAEHIARFEELLPLLADNSALEADLDSLEAKLSTLMDQQRSYMRENTRILQDQEEYNRRFAEMDAECKAVEEQITAIKEQILENTGRKELIRRCLEQLKLHGDLVTEFDTELWGILVESVTIFADSTLTFLFRDETTISGKLPEVK